MRRYQIRVELDERFEPEDVRLDLRTNELHPLHKHDPYIAVSHCGGAMFTFDLTAVDLWTAISDHHGTCSSLRLRTDRGRGRRRGWAFPSRFVRQFLVEDSVYR